MKKLVALILALVLGTSLVYSAIAAERYGGTTSSKVAVIDGVTYAITDMGVVSTNTLYPWEQVHFAVGTDGKLSAKLPYQEISTDGKPIQKALTSVQVTSDGQIVRYKKWIPGSLDSEGYIQEGSALLTVAFIPLRNEYVGQSAALIVDGTALFDGAHISHRAVEEGKSEECVGFLLFVDGNYARVYLTEWENNIRLVFDAGIASKKTGNKPTETPDNTPDDTPVPPTPTPTVPGTGFTIEGEQPTPVPPTPTPTTPSGWDEQFSQTEAPTPTPTTPSGWDEEFSSTPTDDSGNTGFTIDGSGSENPTPTPTTPSGWDEEFSSTPTKDSGNTGFTIDGSGNPTPTPTPPAGWTI